ncbi:MAG: hypothetical protein HYY84_01250 [Deltaproteobacteria bacterium]|nr:hypothetical protein [Deltaproteobacteria bacterium]
MRALAFFRNARTGRAAAFGTAVGLVLTLALGAARANDARLGDLSLRARKCLDALNYTCAARALSDARSLVRAETNRALFIWVHRNLAEVEVALGKLDLARATFRALLRKIPDYRMELAPVAPRLREAFDLAQKDVAPSPTNGDPRVVVPQQPPPIPLDPPLPIERTDPHTPPLVAFAKPLPADPFPFSIGSTFCFGFTFGDDATALQNGVGFGVAAAARIVRNFSAGVTFNYFSFAELTALARNVSALNVAAIARLDWTFGRLTLAASGGLGVARTSVSPGLAATGFLARVEGAVGVLIHPHISLVLTMGADLVVASVQGTVRRSLLLPIGIGVTGHF